MSLREQYRTCLTFIMGILELGSESNIYNYGVALRETVRLLQLGIFLQLLSFPVRMFSYFEKFIKFCPRVVT